MAPRRSQKTTINFVTFVTGVEPTSWCLLRPWFIQTEKVNWKTDQQETVKTVIKLFHLILHHRHRQFHPCVAMPCHFQPFTNIYRHLQYFQICSAHSSTFQPFPDIYSLLLPFQALHAFYNNLQPIQAMSSNFKPSKPFPAISAIFSNFQPYQAITSNIHLFTASHSQP